MADNSTLPVTGGTEVFANDDISSVKYPRVKATWGPDGTANDTDIATGKPLPVQVRSATGLIPIGEPTDAKSAATDTTSASGISIWKQISASIQAAASSLAGTLTVAGSGNFASTVADGANAVEGVTTGAAVITDANGTIQQYLRGLIKQWIAGTLVVGAGSNLIGRTAADASAATGGIPSTARLLSAAGTSGDATNVKASAGRLYSIQGANVRTSALYMKLYNSATAPTAGAGTPVKTLYLPASSAFVFDWPLGLTFSAGIGFTIVTTGPDAGATSCTAADIVALNLDYA